MKIVKFIIFLSIILFFGSFVFLTAQASVYPADINDLEVVGVTGSTISLKWTASGDDGYFGYADHYDMRISKAGITPVAWDLYDQVLNLPQPGAPAVKKEQFTITGLAASTTYSIAVKAVDAAGNSSLSFNVAKGTTLQFLNSSSLVKNLKFFPKLQYQNSATKLFSISIFKAGISDPVISFSKTADSSGAVSLSNNLGLVSGVFDVGVKSDKFLSKKLNNVNLASNLNITLAQMSAGDLNSDGIINSLDWSLLSSSWFTSNASYDLNGDNFINSIDWSIMSKNWFLTGDF